MSNHIGWFVDGAEENSFCLIHKPDTAKEDDILVCRLYKCDIGRMVMDGSIHCTTCGIPIDKQVYVVFRPKNWYKISISIKFGDGWIKTVGPYSVRSIYHGRA